MSIRVLLPESSLTIIIDINLLQLMQMLAASCQFSQHQLNSGGIPMMNMQHLTEFNNISSADYR